MAPSTTDKPINKKQNMYISLYGINFRSTEPELKIDNTYLSTDTETEENTSTLTEFPLIDRNYTV